jgi:hypothetical protein
MNGQVLNAPAVQALAPVETGAARDAPAARDEASHPV